MPDLFLCECGSGLRRVRCCGLDVATLSPVEALAPLLPLLEQGTEAAILAVLELAPGYEDALIALYRLRRHDKNTIAAQTLIRRVVALNPNHFWATNELTLLLLAQGALGEAERHARNAVRIAPQNPQAHNLMGLVLTEANRPVVGEYHYRRVLALAGAPPPITLANLAWNLKTQGRIGEARGLYQQSMALQPDVLQTILGFAKMEEADRNFAAALALLDQAAALHPGHASVQLTRATVLARQQQPAAALKLLEGGEADLGPAELSEQGRLLDRLGRHDEAFAAFDAAKRQAIARGAPTYAAGAAAELAGRLKNFFNARRLETLPVAGARADTPQPVFITGFPRSGTTLVEQTLSVHEQIAAGDELPFIEDLTHTMPRLLGSPLAYPEALAELWMGDRRDALDDLRDHYLNRAAKSGIFRPGAAYFTDKMPLNETHLGLIARLFPNAPVIHVIRHPLDVVLSVYANHLTHGFCCAAQLETIAHHYALIADLVAHYAQALDARLLTVRYEDMVADQDATIRRLLAFIGVAYDPRCRDFQRNRRYARTASYAQVTEKLYDRSRYRYRAYRAHLEPVIAVLRPVITSLGYDTD